MSVIEEMDIPFLLPHLSERICEIECTDLLCVLKLEKFVSAMARHVYEDVTPFVRHQPLTPRHVLSHSVRHQSDEIFNRDFVSPVVYLDVVTVEV